MLIIANRLANGTHSKKQTNMAFALMKKMKEPVGVGDMVLLDAVDEDHIVENLKKRVLEDEIYVSNLKSQG